VTSAQEKTGGSINGNGVVKTPSLPPSQKWTRRYSPAGIFWGIGLLLGLGSLAVGVIISQRCGEQLCDASRAVAHTRQVLEKLEEISTRLGEVESAARSFAISGKESQLAPFYTAIKAVPDEIEDMKALARDDFAALGAFTNIEPAITRHIKAMKEMVELGNKNLFRGSGQRKLTDEGSTLMAEIQTAFNALEKTQRAQLAQEESEVTAGAEHLKKLGLIGNAVAAVLVLTVGVRGLQAINGRRKTEEKLNRMLGSMPDALVLVNADDKIISSNAHTARLFGYAEGELQGQSMALLVPERFRPSQRQYYEGFFQQSNGGVPETTLELFGLHKDGREFPIEISTKPLATEKGMLVTSAIRDASERKRVEKQISELNKELQDRAAELETANKELESFSYSASHDLRSPLQVIDSFSQILIEGHGNQLNEEGRDYIQRMRGSCKHMEEIIDALLGLSKTARHEMVLEQVDLSTLAQTVATELKQKDTERRVDWAIAEGLTASGDARLLRVVLENLFGNAWKFTAKRSPARIEFGALPQSNGARTYFVRDNGAGFDMARAEQLFAPFKRLHTQNEFRGTGIGLATVQRAIRRHQGKIWAEGVVEQGATFCFTLAEENATSNGKDH
jgi:PAS domain S-box-containing protein